MYAILTETKETIALKKKQIEENQRWVNQMALEMSQRVHLISKLSHQVELLDSELYRLEKQVLSDENSRRPDPNAGCSIGPSMLKTNSCDVDHGFNDASSTNKLNSSRF